MPGKTSRNKGADFERKVAKLFSEAYGVELRRTPLSGGWASGNPDVAGDIVSVEPDKDFHYCIECKKSEGWQLESLLTPNHKWFDDWWEQLIDECPRDKTPLLVFSRNRMPTFVATSMDMRSYSDVHLSVYCMGAWGIMILPLEAFLRWDTRERNWRYYGQETDKDSD